MTAHTFSMLDGPVLRRHVTRGAGVIIWTWTCRRCGEKFNEAHGVSKRGIQRPPRGAMEKLLASTPCPSKV